MTDTSKIPVPPEGAASEHASTTAQQPAAQQPAAQQPAAPKARGGAVSAALAAVIGAVVAVALICCLWAFTPLFNGLKNTGTVSSAGGTVTIDNNGEVTTAEAVAAKCLNSAATIYVYSDTSSDWSQLFGGGSSGNSNSPSALGSGVIIGNEGNTYYIVTNYHVVEGISKATVKIGEKEYSATPVGYDEKTDLAVIKIEAEGLTVAEWGASEDLKVGEWVAAIGSPYGYEQTLTTGVVSALYRTDTISSTTGTGATVYSDMIQTDAAINPGNSGGGLFDAEGKLVGINTYISSTSQSSAGLGFAIPEKNAREIVEGIIAGKTVEHAFLGISMGEAADGGGVSVAAVYKDTAADKAGLRTGDVITKIDGKDVSSSKDVSETVSSKKVGDKVSITYKRDGKESSTDATLGSDSADTTEYAEGGAPANSGNGSSNGNGRNGNSGSGNGWYGFGLEDLFGTSPFGGGSGSGGSGNSSSGNSGSSGGGSFWGK